MTERRLPLVPTVVVALAVATMIGLGIWQLQRAEWKAARIAGYQEASEAAAPVAYPRSEDELDAALYRKSAFTCESVIEIRAVPGTNAQGRKGLAQLARCAIAGGGEGEVALGWARSPRAIAWDGGEVEGVIAPGGRIVADPPLAGLEPLARPDPRDMPDNHLAYAGQWFFFAFTALIIYVLALRKRLRSARPSSDFPR